MSARMKILLPVLAIFLLVGCGQPSDSPEKPPRKIDQAKSDQAKGDLAKNDQVNNSISVSPSEPALSSELGVMADEKLDRLVRRFNRGVGMMEQYQPVDAVSLNRAIADRIIELESYPF